MRNEFWHPLVPVSNVKHGGNDNITNDHTIITIRLEATGQIIYALKKLKLHLVLSLPARAIISHVPYVKEKAKLHHAVCSAENRLSACYHQQITATTSSELAAMSQQLW